MTKTSFNIELEKEIFYEEIGKIIYHFNSLIKILPFDTDKLGILRQLIRKVISNTTSANILINEGCYKEAQITLRSSIETVVLIAYLSQFPNKTYEYLADSQIFRIKNNFIAYKQEIEAITKYENWKLKTNEFSYTKRGLIKRLEESFNSILPLAKEKILKGIKENEYKITDLTFSKIDKYFISFKPIFMNLKLMYEELDENNFRLGNTYELREIIFTFYNESSQIAHGAFFDWTFDDDFNMEKEHLFQFFNKTLFVIKLILDNIMNIQSNDELTKIMIEIKKSTDRLNSLIYGEAN